MRLAAALLLVFAAMPLVAQTTANDDSCDIALMPAATLLLPYFEVHYGMPREQGRTTIFTVVNTSAEPQIAHVTLWTDWSYPVLTFNVWLTGYDAQSIDLYDVIVDGRLARTSFATTPGRRSAAGNPRHIAEALATCGPASMPDTIPLDIHQDLQSSLTTGAYSLCGMNRMGGMHSYFAGYVTIDVVAACTDATPLDPRFFAALLYDNVLTGDWQLVDPRARTAVGQPLVHLRAIPEGGRAGARVPGTNLERTFYRRHSPQGFDRRQPLPSTFAVRFVQSDAVRTDFLIWRESVASPVRHCSAYVANGRMTMKDVIRFDERENPTSHGPPCGAGGYCSFPSTPAVLRISSSTALWPRSLSTDAGGWLLVDLRQAWDDAPLQNWVTVMMTTNAGHAAAFDATPLANGCTP